MGAKDFAGVMLAFMLAGSAQSLSAQALLVKYVVSGDRIDAPLTAVAGDPTRGKQTALGRDAGNCQLCHQIPDSGLPVMGDIASSLAGVGARLTVGQLRLRVVDARHVNAATVMPSYYRIDGLNDVASAWRGKPILTAQQVEDVVAYLATLKETVK
jgi:L-cysteine S-thiosulfotransferase